MKGRCEEREMRTSSREDRLSGDLGEDGLGEVGRLGVATHVTGSDGSLLAVRGGRHRPRGERAELANRVAAQETRQKDNGRT